MGMDFQRALILPVFRAKRSALKAVTLQMFVCSEFVPTVSTSVMTTVSVLSAPLDALCANSSQIMAELDARDVPREKLSV